MTTYRRGVQGLLSISDSGDSASTRPREIFEGIVTDVILDELHKFYSDVDGYNIGMIQVKIFGSTELVGDQLLPWAGPLDSTIQEYPLRGELVTLYKIRDAFFYNRKVAIANRLQENSALLLTNQLTEIGTAKKITDVVEQAVVKHNFGRYFKPDSRVRPLRHFEGDVLFQGRMGQSIRFGSSMMDPTSNALAPNIILRAGQARLADTQNATIDTVFGVTVEDINDDASSIWMVSDQNLPFTPSTVDANSLYRSIKSAPMLFGGASIVANSDRVILNAKNTHIMLFSRKEIYLNSFSRTAIDSEQDVWITAATDVQVNSSRDIAMLADGTVSQTAGKDILQIAGQRASTVAKKIHFGSVSSDVEAVVGGTSLAIFLARLIAVLMGPGTIPPQILYQLQGGKFPLTQVPPPAPATATFSHVLTPVGPGVLNPAIVAGLITLYNELAMVNAGATAKLPFSGAPFSSLDTFVQLANEDASLGIVLNDYTIAETPEVTKNSWILTDNSYRVS